uniref:Protein kinase domain-containing protein n=1 Tax=Elaeophora elaphi TaxID=1147741 RepID=A0A0R3S2B5_9BILA
MDGYGCVLHSSMSMKLALENVLHSIDGSIEAKIAGNLHSRVFCVRSGLFVVFDYSINPINDTLLASSSQNKVTFTSDAQVGYLPEHCRYKRLVAIKMINASILPKSLATKFLPRELLFTQMVQHPHIARALSIQIPHPTKIAIISEYYPGGTLLNLILKRGKIPEFPEACRLFRQLTEAIHYLHDRGVVHRDIKAENVLLDANGDVKLIDFGFARYIDRKERSESFCGTKPYTAPEIVQHLPYDAYASDWYAMGVLLFTMLTGKWPNTSSNGVIFPKGIPSRAARALIICLMNKDNRFRGNYDTILNSEWMRCYKKWVITDQHFIYEVTCTN